VCPTEPRADAVCDGGDLDCGSGLLLIIRDAMAPLARGGVLEVRSREVSVKEDLPAWCRMVGHALDAVLPGEGKTTRYFVRKAGNDEKLAIDLEQARGFRWKVRVGWKEGMAARAFARNHSWAVGQPASFDTADAAPSAVEMLLAALGGCLAVGFAWRASKRGIEPRQVEISLSARAENILVFLGIDEPGHPGLAEIEGTLYVDADAEPGRLEELWRDTLARSPVAQSLFRGTNIRIDARNA
jgi:uncharacterized OsmC-like protein/TusA-related sulfurtransferase